MSSGELIKSHNKNQLYYLLLLLLAVIQIVHTRFKAAHILAQVMKVHGECNVSSSAGKPDAQFDDDFAKLWSGLASLDSVNEPPGEPLPKQTKKSSDSKRKLKQPPGPGEEPQYTGGDAEV